MFCNQGCADFVYRFTKQLTNPGQAQTADNKSKNNLAIIN